MAKVTFIVPTLNRGHYVLRAVESCLATETIDAKVEVVVLDSMSDDGSWEQLVSRYADDDRVVLAQNRRGLGPTHSWLDGAKLATGSFITFLWSDDHIAPQFLEILLPHLLAGAELATGDGVVRDIDDDTPMPHGADEFVTLTGSIFLQRHIGLVRGRSLPVSPAVALFTRAVFDHWVLAVEAWCTHPGIRHEIMWKRAIGPDLMLFLASERGFERKVVVSNRVVAQFSSHSGSITVSSSAWPLRVGYWLAKWWAVQEMSAQAPRIAVTCLARLVAQGMILIRLGKNNTAGNQLSLIESLEGEVRAARRQLFETAGTTKGTAMVFTSAAGLAWRAGRRLVG